MGRCARCRSSPPISSGSHPRRNSLATSRSSNAPRPTHEVARGIRATTFPSKRPWSGGSSGRNGTARLPSTRNSHPTV
jgi:hypothetical protein